MKIYQKIIALPLISAIGIFSFACGKEQAKSANSAANTTVANSVNMDDVPPRTKLIDVDPSYAKTPTEGYKGLYEAVKSKDTEKIKSYLTQKTLAFGDSMAAQRKISPAEMYANGFTATNFAEKLPEIRDERVKDNMGAVEVYNEKEKKWEDLPFIFENGGWKLAVGDVFADTYKSPGKGKAQLEMDASNTGKMPPTAGNPTAGNPMPANK